MFVESLKKIIIMLFFKFKILYHCCTKQKIIYDEINIYHDITVSF